MVQPKTALSTGHLSNFALKLHHIIPQADENTTTPMSNHKYFVTRASPVNLFLTRV